MSNDNELLRFIEECLDLIDEYSARGSDAFLAERLLQDAVVRRMEILADAAGRLSDALKVRRDRASTADCAP